MRAGVLDFGEDITGRGACPVCKGMSHQRNWAGYLLECPKLGRARQAMCPWINPTSSTDSQLRRMLGDPESTEELHGHVAYLMQAVGKHSSQIRAQEKERALNTDALDAMWVEEQGPPPRWLHGQLVVG